MSTRWHRALPPAIALAACAAIVVYVLGGLLRVGSQFLPGTDSINLYAWEGLTREALRSWRLPLWNPYQLAGTPYLADTQTTVLYPVALALRWLPPIPFFAWMVAVHLLIAAAGALFLAREVGLGWLSATCAALAVMIGGNAGPWLYNGHLLLIYTAAWLPWALGLSIRSVRRASLMPSPALVVVLVLQFLAGYLQGSVYIVGAVCLYFLFSVAWPEHATTGRARWRPLAQLMVAGALALGLGAFQLFPTIRLTSVAGRIAGLAYELAVNGAWSVRELGRVLFPFIGVDGAPPYRYLSDGSVYVGWLLILLMPFAFLRARRFAVFFGLLSLVAVAFAMGDALPFYRLHHALFPGLRVPGRLLFLATLGLAMLGAMGLERFVDCCQRRSWRPIVMSFAVSFAIVVGAATSAVATPAPEGVPLDAGWPWVPVLPLLGVAVAGAAALARQRTVALLLGLMIVLADLILFVAPAPRAMKLDSVETLRSPVLPDAGRAISVCENRFDVNAMLTLRQPSLDGMGGVYLRDYADWATLAKTGDEGSPSDLFGRVSSEGPFPSRRDLIDQANVTTVFACGPLHLPSLQLVSVVDSIYVYRNLSARPRAVWTCGGEQLARADAVRALRRARYDSTGRLVRRYVINIRWAPGVTDAERLNKEQQYSLLEGEPREGRTWRYAWDDTSRENGLAMLNDPAVEDTSGLDRSTGLLSETAAALAATDTGAVELLVGTSDCADRGTVDVRLQNQVDGRVELDVEAPAAGYVFLSEPYFRERQAFVDGRRVGLQKANLAFTAVPVPAGRHHVELVFVPRSLQAGLGTSATTLVAWLWLSGRRRRAPGRTPAPERTPA